MRPCSSCGVARQVSHRLFQSTSVQRGLTMGNKQHCACWPIAAQMVVKSSGSVGVLGARESAVRQSYTHSRESQEDAG